MTQDEIKKRFIPLDQVKKEYGLSRSFMYKLKYERKLFHYTLGARVFIDRNELEALIEKGRTGDKKL